jgi:site-specific recombinase XerD
VELRKAALHEASRHSVCTQIVESGATHLQAKQLMPHADIRSTEKYFHGNVTKMRDLVNRRGKVIPIIEDSGIEANLLIVTH